MTKSPHSTDAALVALGFVQADDGTLVAPSDSVVTLTPTYDFFELRVSFGTSNTVTVVLHKSALKICREGAR